jgi:hypothetical protein
LFYSVLHARRRFSGRIWRSGEEGDESDCAVLPQGHRVGGSQASKSWEIKDGGLKKDQEYILQGKLPQDIGSVRREIDHWSKIQREEVQPGSLRDGGIRDRLDQLRHLENRFLQTDTQTIGGHSGIISSITVFISHSSGDVEIAKALIELLRDAIPELHPSAIRCTSVPGYKLHGGADTDNQLRQEMRDAPVFVGLLTEQSLASTYVLFELGARWGANTRFTPLVAAGLSTSTLKAPLNGMHAHSCDVETDLHQMVGEMADWLSLKKAGPDVYDGHLKNLARLSKEEGERRLKIPDLIKQNAVTAKPQIKQSQPRHVILHKDELDQWSISNGPGVVQGIVVPFYYDPKSEVRPEIYVRAHLTFLDQESGVRIVVPAACWIEEFLNAVTSRRGMRSAYSSWYLIRQRMRLPIRASAPSTMTSVPLSVW